MLACLCSLLLTATSSRVDQNGWICLHLSGSPHQIGEQYGRLAGKEIDEANRMLRVYLKHNTDKGWDFYREAASRLFAKKLDSEYRDEIQGIADGLKADGYTYDFTDMLAQNAWIELAWYYVPKWDAEHKKVAWVSKAPLNCSAFIATGEQTKDHKIVMAHNAWVDYIVGERFNLILDIKPQRGNRILMDSWPGFIHSGDDFAVNSAGIVVTETTIGNFKGFDENGLPEFMRARKAVQYANSVDDFARIMRTGNNGGYANTWLVGDTKTNEIGELELGLKNVMFNTSTDGVFVSANYPQNPLMIAQECDGDVSQGTNACSDRRARWNVLMADNKGQIDAEMAKGFLADHHDQVRNIDRACGSTLCGHFDLDDRKGWAAMLGPDYTPAGSVQGKVITSDMAHDMSFWAHYGHPCDENFYVRPFIEKHPEFSWELPYLTDMKAQPWTIVKSQ